MKNRKGFTLFELLIVMAIIGLLLGFLVPNLLGAKDRAKETAVKSVMHSLQLAVEAYDMENEIYPMETNVAVANLCNNYLIPGGYVAGIPKNPFTGIAYTDSDAAGKIIYNYDSTTGGYTLKGYNRSGIKEIQELTNI